MAAVPPVVPALVGEFLVFGRIATAAQEQAMDKRQ
jgi:hypothetical protein